MPSVRSAATWGELSAVSVHCMWCGRKSPTQEMPTPWCGSCVHDPVFKEYRRRLFALHATTELRQPEAFGIDQVSDENNGDPR